MLLTQKSLTPRYADKFRCIGPACEDDCCHSWAVTIDRPTYEKYRALPDTPLRVLLDATVLLRVQTPETAAEPDRFFGEVKLNPDGACPFFSADRLCRIHSELGPSHLSSVCASYPRITRTIDSRTETTLQLSCPEAARTVLLDRRFMHLPGTAPGGSARYAPFNRLASELDPPNGIPFQYLWELRQFFLLVLKDRTYPLWQRLFILGLFTKRMTELAANPGTANLPALLRDYSGLMQHSRLRSTLDAVPSRPAEKLAIILEVQERRACLGPIPHRLLDCIRSFMEGVGHTPGLPAAGALPAYLAARTNIYKHFLSRHGTMLENYLVHSIVRNRFPFGDDAAPLPGGTNPMQEHALMALRYTIVDTLATGMAARCRDGDGEAFGPENLVKLIQAFSKSFEHNLDVRTALVDLVEKHKLTTTAGMALLLQP